MPDVLCLTRECAENGKGSVTVDLLSVSVKQKGYGACTNFNFRLSELTVATPCLKLAYLLTECSFFRSDYDDWRPALASLLQPIPFPKE